MSDISNIIANEANKQNQISNDLVTIMQTSTSIFII